MGIERPSIRHLFEVPEVIEVLARWFEAEWEPYYGTDGPGDAVADLTAAVSRDRLPICLVALDDHARALGTIALRAESVSHPQLSPWVVAFLVGAEHRGRGVGTHLIAAVEDEGRRLGFERLYTSTDSAIAMIERRGWRAFDEAPTLRGVVTVYQLAL